MITGKATKKPVEITFRIAEEEEQIKTLEGVMTANKGDYIITGIKGEHYPCKPDIFKASYHITEAQNNQPKAVTPEK